VHNYVGKIGDGRNICWWLAAGFDGKRRDKRHDKRHGLFGLCQNRI